MAEETEEIFEDLDKLVSDEIETEDGDVEIIFSEDGIEEGSGISDFPYFHEENLVTNTYLFNEKKLEQIGHEVFENFDNDKQSRQRWEQTIIEGLDNIGLRVETVNEPFEGSCSAVHPLTIEAATKFQSKASIELFPAKGPVNTKIIGKTSSEKEEKAARIKEHMNWQILNQMPEYYSQGEKLLLTTALIGQGFRKFGYDSTKNSPTVEYVSADQFVISNFEESLKKARRYSHILYLSPNDLLNKINSGEYVQLETEISSDSAYDDLRYPELSDPGPPEYRDIREKINEILGFSYESGTEAEVYTFIEHHCYMDLGEDLEGYELPYIFVIDCGTKKVLSIKRNWDEQDQYRKKLEWFSDYTFVPGFGFYGLGYIHLLGNIQLSLTAITRSLVDSGQYANLQGGFKNKTAKILGDNSVFSPGEYKDVDLGGDELREAFLPLPSKEPSQVLFQMLQVLKEDGQKFADSTEQVISESTNYGPVGTTLALLEASTKFYTAIHKRFHFSQNKELQILSRINKDFLPEEYPYDVIGDSRKIFSEDYNSEISVLPVSDPNVPTSSHRLSGAQTKLQLAQAFPSEVNVKPILKEYLLAMGEDNIDQIIPPEEEIQPLDPVSDVMNAISGKPIKAFEGQDHESHMKIKSSWLNDITQGGSESMRPYVPIIVANIREHQILLWKSQMDGLSEGQNSGKIAQDAAQKITEYNNQRAEESNDENNGQRAAETLANAEIIKSLAEVAKAEDDGKLKSAKAVESVIKSLNTIKSGELQERKQELEEKKENVNLKDHEDNYGFNKLNSALTILQNINKLDDNKNNKNRREFDRP